MKKIALILSCLVLFSNLFGQIKRVNQKEGFITASEFHITRPLTEIVKEFPVDENKVYKNEESEDRENRKPQKFRKSVKDGLEYGNDPKTIQDKMGDIPGRAPLTNWAGQTATGFRPFDPSGAAGLTQYVQMINSTTFKVYNKATGTVSLTATLGNLWSPATANAGDPIVLYDKAADRWFLAQFGSSTDKKIYIAISTSGDATGSYYTYTFVSPAFPDYLKFSVWSDGYYMTSNQAQKVFAFERTAMLAGNASSRAVYTSFSPPQGSGFFVPLSGDASDGTLPTAGTPCPIFSYSDNGWGTGFSDAVNIYQMSVNWVPTTPTGTITLAANIPTAAFDATYNSSWNDVSQPGTTQKLDGIGGVCMYRAQWKTWNGYNTVVLNWAVQISTSQRSIKWCELRQNQSTGAWTMYQEGIYTPDADTRWMGSIAMDNNGSIALAYMKSNATSIYPGLYYTGRRSCDPLGTLPITETTVIAGTGSQTGMNRVGDYAEMVLDPDGITFWHTSEYMGGATGGSAASTRIFSFQVATCGTAAGVSISASASTICAGAPVTFTASPTNGGTAPSYQWQVNGSNVGTNSATYTTSSLTNGQIVTCVMTSNMAGVTGNPATSNAITITVASPVVPSVSISTSSTTICAGASATFTASPTNGGTTPSYQWKVNGTNAGTNSATFSTSTLTNGQIVTCVLTSNATCPSPVTATSNGITMTVTSVTTPSVAVALSSGSNPECFGTSATFTATPSNAVSPSYQWKLNGVNVGTNSTTYSNSALANSDIVTCVMTASPTCPATVTLGTGTTANTTTSDVGAAYPTYYGNGRQQYLIKASELTGLGLTAGNITALGFNVTGAAGNPSTLNGYTIKMAATTATALTTTFQAPAFTTVFGASNYTPILNSLNTHSLTTPFNWNGTSNILIDICFSSNVTGSAAYQTYQTSSSFVSSTYYQIDGTGSTPCTITTGTTASMRPNITFTKGAVSATSNAITMTVNPLPTVGSTATATSVCSGTAVTLSGTGASTYTWTGGVTNGVAFTPTASNTYTLTGTDANGCTATSTKTITVNPLPTVSSTATATSVCSGTSVTLSGTGASTYSWTGGVTNGVAFTPTGTNTYTVTGTDANGCSASSTKTITVNPLPTVGSTATATSVCSGTSVTLSGTGASTYSWTGGVTNGVAFTPTATNTYTVTGTDVNGCTATSTKTITVNNAPTVGSTATATSICSGTAVTLSGTGASTYSWTGGVTNGVAFTPTATNTYTVTGTDANGCSASATRTIAVLPNYTIISTTGTNGTITPLGNNVVCSGSNQTYNITPNSGYVILDVLVDGVSNPSAIISGTYTFTNVTSSHSIDVSFYSSCVPPAFTNCSGNIATIAANGICNNSVIYTSNVAGTSPTLSYNFSGATSGFGNGDGSGSIFNVGTTLVTIDANNACGSATCNFNVIVTDNQAPIPNLTTLPILSGECSVSAAAPTAIDNCSGSIIGTTNDPLIYNSQGTYIIHWLFDDGNGNVTSQNQTVLVQDITSPSIIAPPAVTVCFGDIITLGSPQTNDNCAIANVINDAPANFPIGTTTVTWTASDLNGNTSSATQLVTVNPLPVGSALSSSLCNGLSTNIALGSSIAGSTFNWTSSVISGNVIGNSNCTNNCGSTIADILNNPGTTNAIVNYSIAPISPAGCIGSLFSSNVTVTPSLPVPVITGPKALCGLTTGTYTASSLNATGYSWTVPAGITITSGQVTSSIIVSYGTTITGNITATASNTCGNSAPASYFVTKKPATPGAISGAISLCGATTANYSVAAVLGATSYSWTLPTGITITSGSGTNSINVSVVSTFIVGNITVTAINTCGSTISQAITIYGKAPATPASITGPTQLCNLTTAAYTAAVSTGATGYTWTLPAGLSILSGAGTSSITVSKSTFTSGNISVAAFNSCGASIAKTLALGTATAAPASITGPTLICGLTTATYSAAAVTGAISYSWTVPAGLTISSGQGTSAIVVSFSTYANAAISVTAYNGCSNSAARTLNIYRIAAPGAITGPTVVCGLTTAAYSVAPVTGTTSYSWVVPTGMTIASGQGTTRIVANVPLTMASGLLKVLSQNSCGSSGYSSITIGACANGISTIDKQKVNEFTLYPNPAFSEFTIDMLFNTENELIRNNQNEVTLEMYDALGNKLIQKNYAITDKGGSLKVNIEDFKTGIYLVRIIDSNNNELYTQRVIKE